MRLITVSGPHGVGKDTVVEKLAQDLPGAVWISPVTTRLPRPGERDGREYWFISPPQFEELRAANGLVFWVELSATQSSGTRWEDLLALDGRPGLLNLVPAGARELREKLVSRGGRVLSIYLHASRAERFRRIQQRQPGASDDAINAMLDRDRVSDDPGAHQDFDLVLENPDGAFEAVMATILRSAMRFAE